MKEIRGDILVVDDYLENANLLFDILSENDYEVRQVISGKQALKAVHYDPPDLILLDIMMPGMDGYEVCQHLKASPETENIPVIFLSALHDTVDKIKAFEVGAVDYISKPFEVQEVLVRVSNQMKILQQQRQIQLQAQQLEQEREKSQNLAKQLNELNQQLEEFTSVVAHDLRQPLANIQGFSELILIRYKQQLQGEGEKFVHCILEANNYMNQLMDDLVYYSRLGKNKNNSLQPIDCNQVLEVAIENFRDVINAQETIITTVNLPTIIGNYKQLVKLWENLLDNSLKYRREERLKITIDVEKKAEEWLFKIEDNGIGIEPQYYAEIFEPCRRLHARDDYPGTGIGLAICKKIVQLNGGKIWLESQLNQGTTFYFTWPIKNSFKEVEYVQQNS